MRIFNTNIKSKTTIGFCLLKIVGNKSSNESGESFLSLHQVLRKNSKQNNNRKCHSEQVINLHVSLLPLTSMHSSHHPSRSAHSAAIWREKGGWGGAEALIKIYGIPSTEFLRKTQSHEEAVSYNAMWSRNYTSFAANVRSLW